MALKLSITANIQIRVKLARYVHEFVIKALWHTKDTCRSMASLICVWSPHSHSLVNVVQFYWTNMHICIEHRHVRKQWLKILGYLIYKGIYKRDSFLITSITTIRIRISYYIYSLFIGCLYSPSNVELKTLRPRQNGRHHADDNFKCISWIKIYDFRLRCHWCMFPVVQLTINQH